MGTQLDFKKSKLFSISVESAGYCCQRKEGYGFFAHKLDNSVRDVYAANAIIFPDGKILVDLEVIKGLAGGYGTVARPAVYLGKKALYLFEDKNLQDDIDHHQQYPRRSAREEQTVQRSKSLYEFLVNQL